MNPNQPFEVVKTFGLSVLLKLTKMNIKDLEFQTMGDKFTSNVPLSQVTDAVNATIEKHNIQLKLN
jgi:hypothetical protein